MVLGVRSGAELAKELRLNAIFIERTKEALRQSQVGWTHGKDRLTEILNRAGKSRAV
jgi:hypothetical protein